MNPCLLVQIVESATEVVLSSSSGVVVSRTLQGGVREFDESVAAHLKQQHQLIIGERMAEEIRVRIGSAWLLDAELSLPVKGRILQTGRPETITFSSADFRAAIQEPLSHILETIERVIERCPPELSGKLATHGVLLSGPGSCLRGLDRLLSEVLKLPIYF